MDEIQIDPTQIEKRVRAPARTAGGKPPGPPRSRRGGFQFEVDQQTGIHHNPANPRDLAALEQIARHGPDEVKQAVRQAAARDDQGRAFPSAVLRILLKSRGKEKDNTPAWARGVISPMQTIDGDAKWID